MIVMKRTKRIRVDPEFDRILGEMSQELEREHGKSISKRELTRRLARDMKKMGF